MGIQEGREKTLAGTEIDWIGWPGKIARRVLKLEA